MTVSRREKKLRLLSLFALPLLLAVAFAVNARRNVEDHVRQIETSIRPAAGQIYAGAEWQVGTVRLIGDGRDTKVTFPGQMRLVIVQLAATARNEIGEGWAQCRFTLVDDRGRRWLPLDPMLSRDISRDLDRKAKPVDGCGITSLHPPGEGRQRDDRGEVRRAGGCPAVLEGPAELRRDPPRGDRPAAEVRLILSGARARHGPARNRSPARRPAGRP